LAGEPTRIELWPEGAPGSQDRRQESEKTDRTNGACNVTNIHAPSITSFLPKPEKATGTAILIAPGGGHRMLCLGHEGDALAEWFAEQGIAAFVLRYRLAKEEGSKYTVDEHAMADTRRALRLVRSRASDWKINPDRIGILGFSAGGELAALAAMESDAGDATHKDSIEQFSCQPNFQVLIYPGSSHRFTVSQGMPPAFIALGAKDRDDIALGMAQLYLKYKEVGVPCELHIYSMGSATEPMQPMLPLNGHNGSKSGWWTRSCSTSESSDSLGLADGFKSPNRWRSLAHRQVIDPVSRLGASRGLLP
jgi:endo-1,4-beta-xylanase